VLTVVKLSVALVVKDVAVPVVPVSVTLEPVMLVLVRDVRVRDIVVVTLEIVVLLEVSVAAMVASVVLACVLLIGVVVDSTMIVMVGSGISARSAESSFQPHRLIPLYWRTATPMSSGTKSAPLSRWARNSYRPSPA
jgi:hypothetical protein